MGKEWDRTNPKKRSGILGNSLVLTAVFLTIEEIQCMGQADKRLVNFVRIEE